MRIKKWLVSAAVLFSVAAFFVPAVSAASVPTDGTGTVIENTTVDSSSREFFTIKTADGNVFYIVVDKSKTDDNVYLLTPVTEDSLKALAESAAQKNSVTGASGTSSGLFGSLTSSGTTASSGTDGGSAASGGTAKATAAKSAASKGNIAFLVLVVLTVFAAAYYFKIYKPKHARPAAAYEAEPDEPDERGGDSDADEDDGGDDEPEGNAQPAPAPQAAVAEQTAPRPEQVQPEQTQSEQAHPEQARPEPSQQEPEEDGLDTREPRPPITPRPRREDVRAPEEAEPERTEPQRSVSPTRETAEEAPARQEAPQPAPNQPKHPTFNPSPVQGGGLFAPDHAKTTVPQPSAQKTGSIPFEQEEPEPDEEDMRDYEDGSDWFDNPNEEET